MLLSLHATPCAVVQAKMDSLSDGDPAVPQSGSLHLCVIVLVESYGVNRADTRLPVAYCAGGTDLGLHPQGNLFSICR